MLSEEIAAYCDMAVRAIEDIFGGKLQSITIDDTRKDWEIYQKIARNDFNNLKVNASHNPMNTNRGVLNLLASQLISNISNYVKTLIEQEKNVKLTALFRQFEALALRLPLSIFAILLS